MPDLKDRCLQVFRIIRLDIGMHMFIKLCVTATQVRAIKIQVDKNKLFIGAKLWPDAFIVP